MSEAGLPNSASVRLPYRSGDMSPSPSPEDPSNSIISPRPSTSNADSPPDSATTGTQSASIKRRAAVACRRCRRMRSKCLHNKKPPCTACLEAGKPEECVLPKRGEPDDDRQFRHPRQRADKRAKGEVIRVKREGLPSPRPPQTPGPTWFTLPPDPHELLPERELLIDSVRMFTSQFYQFGFIPKTLLLERIKADDRSLSAFFLLSILAICARYNQKLVGGYGSCERAAEIFLNRATDLAKNEVFEKPNLQRCQAFFLLSIAQQGGGRTEKSYISFGVATRMAIVMRLHREETYETATQSGSPRDIIGAESARRTIWLLQGLDNLSAGPNRPASLPYGETTTLYPCDEEDFENGRLPRASTAPGLPTSSLQRDKSLFASLIKVHYVWAQVSSWVLTNRKITMADARFTEFAKLADQIQSMKRRLPSGHSFDRQRLRRYKDANLELVYICITTSAALSNLMLYRAYVEIMLRIDLHSPDNRVYNQMAFNFCDSIKELYEQMDAFYDRDVLADQIVGSQITAFYVYACALMLSYVIKFPKICLDTMLRQDAKRMYDHCKQILSISTKTWPLCAHWLDSLERWLYARRSSAEALDGRPSTGNVELQSIALLHPRSSSSPFESQFYPPSSTPPQPQPSLPYPGERRPSIPSFVNEPPRLPPMRTSLSGSTELPPLQALPQLGGPQSSPPQPVRSPHGFYPQSQQPYHNYDPDSRALGGYRAPHYPTSEAGSVSSSSSVGLPDDGFHGNLSQVMSCGIYGYGGQWHDVSTSSALSPVEATQLII